MALAAVEGRRQLLDGLVEAADALALALADLGAAYEQLDEYSAEALEEELFGPVQLAYGRAKRAHAAFAGRHGLPAHEFEAASQGLVSVRPKRMVDRAVEAVGRADGTLATLQDSPLPVEFGDVELRADLADVRELIAGFGRRARGLSRKFGR
jgi:hypothetical protein